MRVNYLVFIVLAVSDRLNKLAKARKIQNRVTRNENDNFSAIHFRITQFWRKKTFDKCTLKKYTFRNTFEIACFSKKKYTFQKYTFKKYICVYIFLKVSRITYLPTDWLPGVGAWDASASKKFREQVASINQRWKQDKNVSSSSSSSTWTGDSAPV